MDPQGARRPVRIANCSGFFGDRISAAVEQVEGGPIDVLTGDWLAELTMLILARQRLKHGAGAGYARTFLTQMQQVLGTCLDRGIKVVSNAGGLDPQGLADALRTWADAAGLGRVRIAVVNGDDLMPQMEQLRADGVPLANLDTGQPLAAAGIHPLTANAYLGGRAISAALAAGADVVITGRCTDAALVVGPAAWWHDWDYGTQFDELAGAVVAGHVIECGAQATGGNYPFFTDIAGLDHPGFPIAEVAADGTSVITKHEGTGGTVCVGTVTAQLLYEIGGPAYANPDVVAHFDSIALDVVGADRVRISGVRGSPPSADLKVSMNYLGGFRNSMSLVLTGLDTAAKADLILRTVTGLGLHDALATTDPRELASASRLDVAELAIEFVDSALPDPTTAAAAQSHLYLTVKDADPKKVGKPFTAPVVEAALGSYPGLFPTAPPSDGAPFGVYWPTLVPADRVPVTVALDGTPVPVPEVAVAPAEEPAAAPGPGAAGAAPGTAAPRTAAALAQEELTVPLGAVLGARSGDKGGNANVGLWVPVEGSAAAADPHATYAWLAGYLTPGRVQELLPEAADLTVEVYPLPNLLAVNVVIRGLLGRGVSDSTRLDPQAKGLGEQLRARYAQVPRSLVPAAARPTSGTGG